MKKIAFFGFGKLGRECIRALEENGFDISYIFTHKDLSKNSVDMYAIENKVEYFYDDLRKKEKILKKIECHNTILVSINYRFILNEKTFKKYSYAINLHGSLLPKYRGRTPHVWAIINGEKNCGVTSHLIDKGTDTGKIILQKKVKIEKNDSGFSILKKYEKIYPSLLVDSILHIENNGKVYEQDEKSASYYGERNPKMGYIDFFQNKTKIIDFIRAQSNPYPGAYFHLKNGKKIIINKAVEASDVNLENIGIIEKIDNSFFVKCTNAVLELIDIKIE